MSLPLTLSTSLSLSRSVSLSGSVAPSPSLPLPLTPREMSAESSARILSGESTCAVSCLGFQLSGFRVRLLMVSGTVSIPFWSLGLWAVGLMSRVQGLPLSSECGTCKIVKARFWPWLSGKSPSGVVRADPLGREHLCDFVKGCLIRLGVITYQSYHTLAYGFGVRVRQLLQFRASGLRFAVSVSRLRDPSVRCQVSGAGKQM